MGRRRVEARLLLAGLLTLAASRLAAAGSASGARAAGIEDVASTGGELLVGLGRRRLGVDAWLSEQKNIPKDDLVQWTCLEGDFRSAETCEVDRHDGFTYKFAASPVALPPGCPTGCSCCRSPDDTDGVGSSGDGLGGSACPEGFYQSDSVLWNCAGGSHAGHFALRPGVHPVLKVPAGVQNFSLSVAADADIGLELWDVESGANIFREYSGSQHFFMGTVIGYQTFKVGEDHHTTSMRVLGVTQSLLGVSVVCKSKDAPILNASLQIIYAGVDKEPCTAPLGCEQYHTDVAQKDVAAWGCWVSDSFGNEDSAWATLTGTSSGTADQNATLAKRQWNSAWPELPDAKVSASLAFAFTDTNKDGRISFTEFQSSVAQCQLQAESGADNSTMKIIQGILLLTFAGFMANALYTHAKGGGKAGLDEAGQEVPAYRHLLQEPGLDPKSTYAPLLEEQKVQRDLEMQGAGPYSDQQPPPPPQLQQGGASSSSRRRMCSTGDGGLMSCLGWRSGSAKANAKTAGLEIDQMPPPGAGGIGRPISAAAAAAAAVGGGELPVEVGVEEVMWPPPNMVPPPMPPPQQAPPPAGRRLARDFGPQAEAKMLVREHDLPLTSEATQIPVEPFESVRHTLEVGQEREREVALKELTFLACRDAANQQQAIREVGAAPVLQVMRSHPASPGVQQQACQAMRAMLKNREAYQEEITGLGAVEAVQNALLRHGASSVVVAEEALWTLQKLSMVEEARHKLVTSGGIELVARTMQRHQQEPAVQECSCKLLGNIAYEEDMRSHFSQPGVMEAIMEAMRGHPHDPGVQEGAILALHNIACSDSTNLQRRIKDLGGMALIQHTISTHPFLNQDNAAEDLLDSLRNLP